MNSKNNKNEKIIPDENELDFSDWIIYDDKYEGFNKALDQFFRNGLIAIITFFTILIIRTTILSLIF